MSTRGDIIIFSVRSGELAPVRARVQEILEEQIVESDVIESIVLAVDEAMTNIACHAYRGTQGVVDVEISLSKENVTVTLLHSGEQFAGEVPTEERVAQHVAERRRGGYGLFLMKQTLDALEFGAREHLSFVKLVKRRRHR